MSSRKTVGIQNNFYYHLVFGKLYRYRPKKRSIAHGNFPMVLKFDVGGHEKCQLIIHGDFFPKKMNLSLLHENIFLDYSYHLTNKRVQTTMNFLKIVKNRPKWFEVLQTSAFSRKISSFT